MVAIVVILVILRSEEVETGSLPGDTGRNVEFVVIGETWKLVHHSFPTTSPSPDNSEIPQWVRFVPCGLMSEPATEKLPGSRRG